MFGIASMDEATRHLVDYRSLSTYETPASVALAVLRHLDVHPVAITAEMGNLYLEWVFGRLAVELAVTSTTFVMTAVYFRAGGTTTTAEILRSAEEAARHIMILSSAGR